MHIKQVARNQHKVGNLWNRQICGAFHRHFRQPGSAAIIAVVPLLTLLAISRNAQANTGDGGEDRCSAAFCEPAAGFDTSVGIPATFADTPQEASSEASGNLRAEYAACIGPVHHHTP